MSDHAAQLAGRLEAVNGEFIDVVTACSPEQWQRTSNGEGWTVGVVAHHAAGSQAAFNGLIQALVATNGNVPPVTPPSRSMKATLTTLANSRMSASPRRWNSWFATDPRSSSTSAD